MRHDNSALDEGLPEVVADPSPETLTSLETHNRHHQQDERDKYPVDHDDAPQLLHDVTSTQEHPRSAARSPDGSVPWEPLAAGEGATSVPKDSLKSHESEPTVWGIRRKTFFLLLIAAVVVVAAAVGGGVGGGVAAARSRKGLDAPSPSTSLNTLPTSSQTSTPTSIAPTQTTSTSSETSPTATFLNNQTGPVGFAFQGFSGINYTGEATKIFRDEGFYDFGADCLSYVWLPNATNCCVTFCEDQHNATGYRCGARKRPKASAGFPRIYIWCDAVRTKAGNTCS